METYASHMPLHVTMEEPNTWVVGLEADHRVTTRWHGPCITSHRCHWHTSAGIAEPERRGIVVGIYDTRGKDRMDVMSCAGRWDGAVRTSDELHLMPMYVQRM